MPRCRDAQNGVVGVEKLMRRRGRHSPTRPEREPYRAQTQGQTNRWQKRDATSQWPTCIVSAPVTLEMVSKAGSGNQREISQAVESDRKLRLIDESSSTSLQSLYPRCNQRRSYSIRCYNQQQSAPYKEAMFRFVGDSEKDERRENRSRNESVSRTTAVRKPVKRNANRYG